MESPASIMNQASTLNAIGVTSFAKGDLPSALRIFREALVTAGRALPEDDEATPTTQPNDTVIRAAEYSGTLKGEMSSLDEGMDFFVWKEALLVNLDLEDSVVTIGRAALLLAVVAFNLALIFHLQSLQQGGRRQARKALSLYNFSLTHLELGIESVGDTANNVLIAASSNMAQLLSQEPNNHNEVQQLLNDVSEICMYMSQQACMIFNPEEMNEFFLNKMVYDYVELRLPAAA